MQVTRAELFQYNCHHHHVRNKVSHTKALFQITKFLLHILSEGKGEELYVVKPTSCLRFITNSKQ